MENGRDQHPRKGTVESWTFYCSGRNRAFLSTPKARMVFRGRRNLSECKAGKLFLSPLPSSCPILQTSTWSLKMSTCLFQQLNMPDFSVRDSQHKRTIQDAKKLLFAADVRLQFEQVCPSYVLSNAYFQEELQEISWFSSRLHSLNSPLFSRIQNSRKELNKKSTFRQTLILRRAIILNGPP